MKLLQILNPSRKFSAMMILMTCIGFAALKSEAQITLTAPSLTITPACGPAFPTAYNALGNIIFDENNTTDINACGCTRTIIMTAPANFEFQAGAGSIAMSGGDISGGLLNVTSTTITVTYTVDGSAGGAKDKITVSGIQVRALAVSAAVNATVSGGTFVIAGVAVGSTVATFTCNNNTPSNYTSTTTGGNWNVTTTWIGGVVPPSGCSNVTIDGPVVGNATTTVNNLTINSGKTLTGTNAITVTGTFAINGTGTYIHNNTTAAATTIFAGTEAFSSTSTFQVNNWSNVNTSIITGESSNFGNLILNWNSGGFLWDCEGLGTTRIIQGNLAVQNSCGMGFNRIAGNVVVTIGGNLTVQTGGVIYAKYSCSGNMTVNVGGATTIADASSVFYGIFAAAGNATGDFTFTTGSYNQSAGNFYMSNYGGFPVSYIAGGSVTFTCAGAYTQSGGTHYGNNFNAIGNFGTSNYSMQSMNFTGGVFVAYSTSILDGRTNTFTVTNNLNVAFAATTDFFLLSNILDPAQNQNETVTVGGNFTVSGAAATLAITVDGLGTTTVSIAGDMSISGGLVYFPYSNLGPLNQTVGGHVTFTGGTTTFSTFLTSKLDLTVGTASVNWNQTVTTVSLCNTNVKSGKTVTLNGTRMGNIQTARTITVESGAKLYCSNFPVAGTGAFTLASGGWIGSGSAAGLTASGATGNIQVSGTRSYNTGATYEFYEAITPQSTGNFTTTTTSGTYPVQLANLIINKTLATNVVNLSSTTDVNTTLTLTSGVLTTSSTAATAPWVRIPTDAATVSPAGGSANSYVDGYIRKTGSAAFVYPTGNAGKWRRIAQSAPTASTEFEARYVSTPYTNTTNMAASPVTVLDHVSLVEHWFLSKPLGATASTAKVTLYWEDAGASGIFKFDSLAVARWSGTGWENTNCYGSCPANWTSSTAQRTYTGSATGSGAGTITSNTVSSFSPFTFASIGSLNLNPLPIDLVTFQAHLNQEQVDLNWVTATETNNDYFSVEKSKDGQTFEFVDRVDGPLTGNSTAMREYYDIDYTPYKGISYYRLKQTDYDGKITYSNIVPVEYNPDGEAGISIFPNPTDEGTSTFLSLNLFAGQEILVVLRDITGRELFSKVVISSSDKELIALDMEGKLAKGSYIVTATSKNKLYNKKLIVK